MLDLSNDVNLFQGDCLEVMKGIPDGSIDLVLTDPPYGTTQNKWDSVIDLERMWEQVWRVLKLNGACVLFCSQPFTTLLVSSQIKNYRQSLVWEKNKSTGHLNANRMHMRAHEDIMIFYKKLPIYNPQMGEGVSYNNKHKEGDSGDCYGKVGSSERKNVTTRYPRSVLRFDVDIKAEFHPTQKPVPLLEYLIKTYTDENETVLDFTMGSGSTGVACKNLNRKFIGIELDETYFNIAKERIEST